MKNRTIVLVALLSAPFIAAAQTTEKTMLKSFNLDGKDQITLALPGTVETKEWSKPTVQIQITVGLPNGNAAMLNELANVGRYNLTVKPDGTQLVITAPNLSKVIKIKGMDLKENITFVVYVPKGLPVKIQDASTTTAAIVKNE